MSCAVNALSLREGTRSMFPSSGPLEGGTAVAFRVDVPDGGAEYTATFAGGPPQPLQIHQDGVNLLDLAETPPHSTPEAVRVEVSLSQSTAGRQSAQRYAFLMLPRRHYPEKCAV